MKIYAYAAGFSGCLPEVSGFYAEESLRDEDAADAGPCTCDPNAYEYPDECDVHCGWESVDTFDFVIPDDQLEAWGIDADEVIDLLNESVAQVRGVSRGDLERAGNTCGWLI